MTLVEVAQNLILAVLFGSLVGIEREHTRFSRHLKGIPICGIRTTMLFSLLGFICAYISKTTLNQNILILGAVIAITITTVVYLANVFIQRYTGATTYVTMIIVFFMGLLAGIGGNLNLIVAGIIAILTTTILAIRREIIGWAKKVTKAELFGALKFGIIVVIIYPLLPNYSVDPWGVFNPAQIWFVIMAVSGISFVSYILMKKFSSKGLLISSIFGGFVSGSATVYQIGEWVKHRKKLIPFATPSVLLACLTGQAGDVILIAFVLGNLLLLKEVALAYTFGMVSLLLMSFVLYKKHRQKTELKLYSPFAFMPALKFGAMYFGLTVLSFLLKHYFGDFGIMPVVVAGSLISSTAMIASLATLSKSGGLDVSSAAPMVVLAIIVALLVKYFWIKQVKDKKFKHDVLITTSISAIFVAAGYVISRIFLGG